MSKLLILLAMALLLPIMPALACFPSGDETQDVLFAAGLRGRTSEETAFQFGRDPIPMSFCELDEPGFAVVNGKCYDVDAITDFETEEECQADSVCKAYREQQQQEQESNRNPEDIDICKETPTFPTCYEDAFPPKPEPEPVLDCSHEGLGTDGCRPIAEEQGDPNHGEIKGDEELEQDEEEHQEEEKQGKEEPKETTTTAAETD
jgi:hypothetical protein